MKKLYYNFKLQDLDYANNWWVAIQLIVISIVTTNI